jgi:peptidoglycan glycosyltransferase
MNLAITRLFVLVMVLFAVLIAATSWWSVDSFGGKRVIDNAANRRPLIQEQRVPRGVITARDGTRLAVSVRHGSGETLRYSRRYPSGSLFSHAIGYSYIDRGDAATEKYRTDQLAGRTDEFNTLVDDIAGSKQEGNNLKTNLDPQAQRVAFQGLAGRRGAVVAMEPSTGKVRVMASVPQYDANSVPTRYQQLNSDPASPLVNRVTQSQYPPGSTFKVVTAVAAIDSGQYTPDSIINGDSPKKISGVPLQNDGGESFGPITLTDALTNSVNTVFGQVGEKVGKKTIIKYMRRFGFGAKPQLDYPHSEMGVSGVLKGGRALNSGDSFDVGRAAIGQGQVLATPLQMVEVAAAVGNHGVLMKPRLADKVTKPDGRVDEAVESSQQSRVMKPDTAHKVGEMMSKVVEEGTGTASALQGIRVAGKTGTAEVDNGNANQAWFICFAPVDKPRYAVAVTIERTQEFGGVVAAPIAKNVLETLLKGGG